MNLQHLCYEVHRYNLLQKARLVARSAKCYRAKKIREIEKDFAYSKAIKLRSWKIHTIKWYQAQAQYWELQLRLSEISKGLSKMRRANGVVFLRDQNNLVIRIIDGQRNTVVSDVKQIERLHDSHVVENILLR